MIAEEAWRKCPTAMQFLAQKIIESWVLVDDTVFNTPAKPMPTPVGTLKSRGFFIAFNPSA
jgi:hypothetical protein